jgi:glycosyltransferase involved in cell wall biosynthesis
MANVTYVFTQNRKEKYEKNLIEAREFYYGLPFIDPNQNDIKVIEFNNSPSTFFWFIEFFENIVRRIFSLPIYTSKLLSKKNIKIFKQTEQLILIPESTGFSALWMLIFLKKKYKITTHLFVMGLYSKKLKFPSMKHIHFYLISVLISYIDNVFFLGEGEYKKALKIHNQPNKFHFFPFSIDTEFWSEEKIKLEKNNQIVFVGNDGNRDYELLSNIAKKLKDFDFVFISKNENLQNINSENIHTINGSWGSLEITDEHLKKIYLNSRLCILPLKNSTQPSGQSVALQCMSLGLPVLISRTDGFWDPKNLNDKKEIFFIENTIESWVDKINDLYYDLDSLEKVSSKAKKVVKENYNLNLFNNRLKKYLNI